MQGTDCDIALRFAGEVVGGRTLGLLGSAPTQVSSETTRRVGTILPVDLARRYSFPRALSGKGECIGILSFGGGVSASDLTRYFEQQAVAVPDVRFENVTVANRPNLHSQYDVELALDIQVVGQLAPGARIVVYFGSNDQQGWLDTVSRAVHDRANQPSVLSISWGATEDWWKISTIKALNDQFENAARRGITICAASGNQGCAWDSNGYCRVMFPASSPFVLSCGGTTAQTSGAEVVWYVKNEAASGGGISDQIPRPAWQPSVVNAVNLALPSRRDPRFDGRQLPDVSGLASPYSVYVGGRYHNVTGGTSAVAPLWSALLACINEGMRERGKPRVGFFSPRLYRDRSVQQSFHNITSGHNDPFGQNGYQAHQGWNACTGWGNPNGERLLDALLHSN